MIVGKIAHSGRIFVLELWYNKVAVIINEYRMIRVIGVMSATNRIWGRRADSLIMVKDINFLRMLCRGVILKLQ